MSLPESIETVSYTSLCMNLRKEELEVIGIDTRSDSCLVLGDSRNPI